MDKNTETIEMSEENRKIVYTISRIFARTALVEGGAEAPEAEEVTAEWQRDKTAYQNRAHRFVRSLEKAGYGITPQNG